MIVKFALAVLLAAALSSTASAHAFLTRAVPPVGSTVKAAPTEVAITYSESVEPTFSTIEVTDAAGTRVDARDLHISPDSDKRLMIGLKPLPAGTYTVTWHATSTDTHKTEGSYSFTVRP